MATITAGATRPSKTHYPVIAAISVSHFLNDMMQSVLLAIYPILKLHLSLSFTQIGLITLAFQLTGSVLQPLIGMYADRKSRPYTLPMSMLLTLSGLLVLATATHFHAVLVAAMLIGMGSSVFHPESSRVARLAAGQQPGLAQSIFQVGGNMGSAVGPLLAALLILPRGLASVAWLSLAALIGAALLTLAGRWAHAHMASLPARARQIVDHGLSRRTVLVSLGVLFVLIFSKFVYMASLSNYYTFYLIEKFQLSTHSAQLYLFVFLFAVAAGTLLGGPVGDRIGRKRVIWWSILGVAPFTLLLPYANLFWTGVLSVIIGLVLSSAFSAILVYAQELVPGKVATISGLFFGLAFGTAGISAALLGMLVDSHGLQLVYQLCAFMPLIGVVTMFLPDIKEAHASGH